MIPSERNHVVLANLPLVGYLVSEVAGSATHLSRDDLAAAGSIALIEAADAFDPTRGVPFGAYARERIIGAIKDEMRRADWAKRAARQQITATMKTQEQLTAALGREPTVDEIAHALGVDRATAAQGVSYATRTVTSLDAYAVETIVSPQITPDEAALINERLDFVHHAVESLPERLRDIVKAVYFEDRSVTELAEELGVTHSAVSQQRAQAIALLKAGLEKFYGDSEPVEEPERKTTPRTVAYLDAFRERALPASQRMRPTAG
ncbi:sigma-70 family RNA polymerase sigma factor [Gryllotalpicola sp.]|uniref:sigma-70 family RNA polymerase sigma factor n=1 Tax=Gryllotalpicola sp. TaxID=1932787 RepID=UPI0026110344|nr:sigma-70 family RNA polymerase sigma factor [Gryllotalpicola sp.]